MLSNMHRFQLSKQFCVCSDWPLDNSIWNKISAFKATTLWEKDGFKLSSITMTSYEHIWLTLTVSICPAVLDRQHSFSKSRSSNKSGSASASNCQRSGSSASRSATRSDSVSETTIGVWKDEIKNHLTYLKSIHYHDKLVNDKKVVRDW